MEREVRGTLSKEYGRWYMRIVYIENHKQHHLKRTTGLPATQSHKKKAKAMLEELVHEYKHKVSLSDEIVTVTDLVERWLRQKTDIRQNTLEIYCYQCNAILDYFLLHPCLVRDLTPHDITEYYAYEKRKGLSAKTIKEHHSNLTQALDYAIELRLIQTNPAKVARLPKREKPEVNFLDLEQTQTLLDAVRGHTLEVPVTLAVNLGLRRSEVLGLRWEAIDFTKSLLYVDHTTILVGSKMEDMAKTKNATSKRILPLSSDILSYLKKVKHSQMEAKLKAGDAWDSSGDGFVCIREDGRRISPSYVSQNFKKFCKQNGLKEIRFHDLRHSCASLLISMGYQLKDVQDFLGHASISTTADIYGHVDLSRKSVMQEGLSKALKTVSNN